MEVHEIVQCARALPQLGVSPGEDWVALLLYQVCMGTRAAGLRTGEERVTLLVVL